MKIQTPLRYPGGKSKAYPYIRELTSINKCNTYIEPYAGGAGVAISLLLNEDVKKIIINDYDKAIYAFWYSVINFTEDLIALIMNTDVTIEEWYIQRSIYQKKEDIYDLLKIGFATLFLNRTNRSGILKAGVIGGKEQNGKYKLDCRFNKKDICEKILRISKYKEQIQLYNMDAEIFVKEIIAKTESSFTFFDPPYYEKGPGLYTNFYNHQNHLSLSQTIRKYMKSKMWILTYDKNENILLMYKDFHYNEYFLNYSIGNPSKGIEYIFYSKLLNRGDISKYLKTTS
ncbi:DNA adenine methylase [Staphylococcus pseudintermedius]|uniref:DNA adenine methylase n=1 Tax=Staphylococcus pseudintermedius TaxID=283734 RepID=UPI001A0B12E0|nr:DNA adenine methylase [Staphylococcus pseudintermedius]EGQ2937024.1 DNA adenine methylase [Staphylococcus pseudintermedius]EGQ3885273.1 DNA adenine methylase [Staphylococcus pseudintermedius]EGQ3974988.1 DNA adenine methylase [Staphylococcus pseudintermedius]EGQ4207798.1 DNA adenine methylase [Staphylococcus pseudintermedius]EGQ4319588.1 DNA adenine methylase [Staphylococcus pseudintermedius]